MAVILPTAYLPPVAYMSEVLHAGQVCIEQHETYRKQSFRNRCLIYGPNGIQPLIIPVKKPFGNHTKTKDIQVSYDLPWQKIHWRSILTAYSNTPYFLHYCDALHPFYEKRFSFLIDFNEELLLTLIRLLNIDLSVIRSSLFTPFPSDDDLREQLISKHYPQHHPFQPYFQVFSPVHGFLANLSTIDLIFHLGRESSDYLREIAFSRNDSSTSMER